MKHRVKVRTKAFNRPGISPTEKNGTDMGWVDVGFSFDDYGRNIKGWYGILANKWIKASDCENVIDEPPPVDPPIINARERHQERFSKDGGVTWGEWKEYEEVLQ